MNRPLVITTPTHAVALATYAGQACLGVLYVIGVASADSMRSLVGGTVTTLWALALFSCGLMCLIAAMTAPGRPDPDPALRLEFYGAVGLAGLCLLYEVTLVSGFGFLGVATTQVLALSVAGGALGRAVQIKRERGKLARARAHPLPAEPPPLAEQDDDTGG